MYLAQTYPIELFGIAIDALLADTMLTKLYTTQPETTNKYKMFSISCFLNINFCILK
jgi:hypothetical protein